MRYQFWHKAIIAYRLEDKKGNSPFIVNDTHNSFAENVYPDYGDYHYAYLDLTKFIETEYRIYYSNNNYYLYEYLLRPDMCAIDNMGAVLFQSKAVITKTLLSKGVKNEQN